MKESIKTKVVDSLSEITEDLDIEYNEDVLTFRYQGKEVFSGDWTNNFREVFLRALEIWPAVE